MSPRSLSTVAALVSLITGLAGLLVPAALASAFGVTFDATGTMLARLACTSYLGYAALNWTARDVTDASAWRAIGIGNATAWGLGTIVTIAAVASGLAGGQTLGLVAMQVTFALAWILTAVRAPAHGGEPAVAAL